MWRLILADPNVFFNYIYGGILPLHTRRVLAPQSRRVQGTAYRLPDQGEGEKFKSLYGYILNLTIDKPNTAIYVSYETLKTFDLSKLKLLGIKMFYIKHSLSPNCMRAIFRLEEIQFPPKKNLLISQAVYKCFI